jgi:hypothetical protein
MPSSADKIDDLRRQIDEIDNKLHDLLMLRADVAAQVGALHCFLGQVAERIGQNPRLVVTGGAAPIVTPMLTPMLTTGLELEFTADPWLVFRGMALV